MSTLRTVVVALIAALEVAGFVTTLMTYQRSVAEFGYNIGSDGVTVVSIEPGLAAQRASIAVGDKLIYQTVPRAGRMNTILNEPVDEGEVLRFDVERAGVRRTVEMRPVPFPFLWGISDLFYAFAGLALGTVSLALVLLRPSRLTWGFALVAPPLLLPTALMRWSHHGPAGAAFAYVMAVTLLYAMQAAGMMIFASRFPDDDPRGPNAAIDRLAIPTGVATAAIYAYTYFNIWFSTTPPPHWTTFVQYYLAPAVPTVAALFALFATYAASTGQMRSRLTPTLICFLLLVITDTAQQIGESITSNPSELLFAYFAFAIAAILVAASVAYAVVRHRVIDVSFIVGRTLVYTILTLFAVGVFSLIEYFVGKLLEHGGLALVLEILAAIAIGLSMNALHIRLDWLIDTLLFRRRHLAEARVKQTAAALQHAQSRAFVDRTIVADPVDAFGLASGAVFVLDPDGGYTRTADTGWTRDHAKRLLTDDRLVVQFRSDRTALNVAQTPWRRDDFPSGAQQPLYALAVTLGTRVEAIALFGGHAGGEDLDPDERHCLRRLADGAALAYDHLAAEALRRRLSDAESEIASLRRVERRLTQLLDERLHPPAHE